MMVVHGLVRSVRTLGMTGTYLQYNTIVRNDTKDVEDIKRYRIVEKTFSISFYDNICLNLHTNKCNYDVRL